MADSGQNKHDQRNAARQQHDDQQEEGRCPFNAPPCSDRYVGNARAAKKNANRTGTSTGVARCKSNKTPPTKPKITSRRTMGGFD